MESELTVLAEGPGFNAKDLEIKVEPMRLNIAGRRETNQEKHGKRIYTESCADQILRVIDLPAEVDTTRVSAKFEGRHSEDRPSQGRSCEGREGGTENDLMLAR